MFRKTTFKVTGVICIGVFMATSPVSVNARPDIIEIPSQSTSLAPHHLLNDADQQSERIVSAGERGHIIYSDNAGETWEQSNVPVSVTLTGIDLVPGGDGWAVGHSGVVLHSDNGGQNWEVQLTGVEAAELAIKSKKEQIKKMERRLADAPQEDKADLEWALGDLQFSLENLQADLEIGPVNPLLDVWFENDRHGFVVGAYGMFLRTQDGGNTWTDWAPTLDNPNSFHLNDIVDLTGGALMVVGEAGQIFVSVDGGGNWEKRESPYRGSLFGAVPTGQAESVLAFGLRGNMIRSTDLGRSWTMVTNEAGATLNKGTLMEDGTIILVGNGGTVLRSSDGAETFHSYSRRDREGIMDVVPLSGSNLLLFGEGGVKHADAFGKNLQ